MRKLGLVNNEPFFFKLINDCLHIDRVSHDDRIGHQHSGTGLIGFLLQL